MQTGSLVAFYLTCNIDAASGHSPAQRFMKIKKPHYPLTLRLSYSI